MIVHFKNSPEPSLFETFCLFLKIELMEFGVLTKVYDYNAGLNVRKVIIFSISFLFLLALLSPIIIASIIYSFNSIRGVFDIISIDRLWYKNPPYESLNTATWDDLVVCIKYLGITFFPFLAPITAYSIGFLRKIIKYLNN